MFFAYYATNRLSSETASNCFLNSKNLTSTRHYYHALTMRYKTLQKNFFHHFLMKSEDPFRLLRSKFDAGFAFLLIKAADEELKFSILEFSANNLAKSKTLSVELIHEIDPFPRLLNAAFCTTTFSDRETCSE